MSCQLSMDPFRLLNVCEPIVIGVTVTSGTLEIGNKISVPSKNDLCLGIVSRINSYDMSCYMPDSAADDDSDKLVVANEGEKVVVTIDTLNGDAPKMYMRYFDHSDTLFAHM